MPPIKACRYDTFGSRETTGPVRNERKLQKAYQAKTWDCYCLVGRGYVRFAATQCFEKYILKWTTLKRVIKPFRICFSMG